MLTRLHIQGFKSIRSASVDLGVVNVFVGANGSGKSNVLEALGVLGAALFGSVDPEPLKYRGVRPGRPSLYKTSLRGARIPRVVQLHASNGTAEYRIGLDNPINHPERSWTVQSESLYEDVERGSRLLGRSPRGCVADVEGARIQLSPKPTETAAKTALQQQPKDSAPRARALVDQLIDYAIFSPTTNVLRGLASDVSREPLGLSGSHLPNAIRQLLPLWRSDKSTFDFDEILELVDWAQSFSVVATEQVEVSPDVNVGRVTLRFVDRYMAANRNALSAYDASEGALYVLFLVALASHPSAPRLFAVDNFDHALHPRLAARLTSLVSSGLVAEGERQMLLTTHNPLVLDGLDLRDDRVRLFAVERAREHERDADGAPMVEGETLIRRVVLTPQLLDEVRSGMSLSRLWIMGRLGGVPREL